MPQPRKSREVAFADLRNALEAIPSSDAKLTLIEAIFAYGDALLSDAEQTIRASLETV